MTQTRILAGDIGGTKTTLAIFAAGAEAGAAASAAADRPALPRTPEREVTYPSAEHGGLLPIVQDFLAGERAPLAAACFGIAGPVVANRSVTPNLPWVVDGGEIARATGIARVELVNDLVAMGLGIAALGAADLATLQEGVATPVGTAGNAALLAAGTGLGITVMAAGPDGFRPLPSEGGHQDLAPRTDEEIALLRYLRPLYGRVSAERAISGPGLHNIYKCLRDSGFAREQPEIRARLAAEDPGAVIGEAAIAGACALCTHAVEMFAGLYGAVAGNTALLGLATQGVFLGGGIAPKLLPKLQDGRFLAAFLDKGRMRPLLETFPVKVILEPKTPLLGAARRAAELAGS